MRAVHSTKIPFEIEGYTKNEYLIDKIYNPVLVCDKILEKAPVYFLQKYGNILREKMEEYKKVIDKSPYKIGLIHGDLRGSNILLSEGDISLIDWADSRLDIISCDIAQLFYLLDFNQLQEHAFLKKYQEDFVTNDIIIMHKILLSLYDIVWGDFTGKTVKESGVERLEQLLAIN